MLYFSPQPLPTTEKWYFDTYKTQIKLLSKPSYTIYSIFIVNGQVACHLKQWLFHLQFTR